MAAENTLKQREALAGRFSEIEDLEIIADVVRICRSARFSKGEEVMREVTEMYPAEPIDRIKRCAHRAATLLEGQHVWSDVS